MKGFIGKTMSTLQIIKDEFQDIRFVKPTPGSCVIGQNSDTSYHIYTHNKRYSLTAKNGKYTELAKRNEEYNSIEEFITKHGLQCVSIETTEVKVKKDYGHPEINYLVYVTTPNNKHMLISIDDDTEGDVMVLNRAMGSDEWVPEFPYLVFGTVKKLDKFIDKLNMLQMLSR